jgi:hypothetical protein
MVKAIINRIKPLLLVSFNHHNQDLGLEYIDHLEKQREFIQLDLNDLCEAEIERGTQLGNKMNAFHFTGQQIPAKF